jgi:hypothetical protein
MSLDSILSLEMILLAFLLCTSYSSQVSASSHDPESQQSEGERRSDGSRFLSSLTPDSVPGIITVDEDGGNIGDIIVLSEDESQKSSGKKLGMDMISMPHQQHHYPSSIPFGVRFGSSPPSTQSSPPAPISSYSGEQDNESVESPFDMDPLSTQEAEKYIQAASHHHHGGHGGHHGWLDMGAYSGKHGSFGWYADFPVGGGHGGYHGRRR